MTYQPKEEKIIDETISVKVSIKGENIVYIKQEIQNTEKLNHKIYGKFFVKQRPRKSNLNVKFYILTDLQFLKWDSESAYLHRPAFSNHSKSSIVDPEEYLYSSKDALPEGNFEISVDNTNSIFFIIDNSHSAFKSKDVKLEVWEKWEEKIPPVDIITKRKKFVSVKEELDKAEKNLSDHPEDVFNYLRTAIDLSIKGKFGFQKIPRMSQFVDDAKKYNFPLPSYNLIYSIFSEGSSRLHGGEVNTRFEAEESIRVVRNFVDSLSKLDVSQEQIEDFKKKSKSVS